MTAFRHDIVSQHDFGFKLYEIAHEVKVEVEMSNGGDSGYHLHGNDWWLNLRSPNSYQYLSIDSLYPAAYFEPGVGHPDQTRAREIYDYMQAAFRLVFKRDFASVLELGTGGGEITQIFAEKGLDFFAVEGTKAGFKRLMEIGISSDRAVCQNLKFMPVLNRRFDIAMCTEVAEHIEPFFASKVVENCINHSDVVWFSSADRNRRPHYHHCNEQDIEVWDNLFAHMGFPFFVPLDGRHDRASRMYISKETGQSLQKERS